MYCCNNKRIILIKVSETDKKIIDCETGCSKNFDSSFD
jgi:hypothetical protein